jgi:hypothetical protein
MREEAPGSVTSIVDVLVLRVSYLDVVVPDRFLVTCLYITGACRTRARNDAEIGIII